MNDFNLWFATGFEHIASLDGFDHILFVSLLVFAFPIRQWQRLVALVTAFTLGHSLSLALGVSGMVKAPRLATELLIALTILLSALYQLFKSRQQSGQPLALLYCTVAVFGLIHGLGFSFLLQSMLSSGESLVWPLLYFNLGLETGQLLILALVILFSLLLTSLLKIPYKPYKSITVCIIALIALKLCVERSLELFHS